MSLISQRDCTINNAALSVLLCVCVALIKLLAHSEGHVVAQRELRLLTFVIETCLGYNGTFLWCQKHIFTCKPLAQTTEVCHRVGSLDNSEPVGCCPFKLPNECPVYHCLTPSILYVKVSLCIKGECHSSLKPVLTVCGQFSICKLVSKHLNIYASSIHRATLVLIWTQVSGQAVNLSPIFTPFWLCFSNSWGKYLGFQMVMAPPYSPCKHSFSLFWCWEGSVFTNAACVAT